MFNLMSKFLITTYVQYQALISLVYFTNRWTKNRGFRTVRAAWPQWAPSSWAWARAGWRPGPLAPRSGGQPCRAHSSGSRQNWGSWTEWVPDTQAALPWFSRRCSPVAPASLFVRGSLIPQVLAREHEVDGPPRTHTLTRLRGSPLVRGSPALHAPGALYRPRPGSPPGRRVPP